MRRSVADVGEQHHVAVARLPARHRVAVDGVHVDVDREEVVARLGAVRQHLLLEEAGRDALADEAALRVGERDDHRVDLAGGDRRRRVRRSSGFRSSRSPSRHAGVRDRPLDRSPHRVRA